MHICSSICLGWQSFLSFLAVVISIGLIGTFDFLLCCFAIERSIFIVPLRAQASSLCHHALHFSVHCRAVEATRSVSSCAVKDTRLDIVALSRLHAKFIVAPLMLCALFILALSRSRTLFIATPLRLRAQVYCCAIKVASFVSSCAVEVAQSDC